MAATKSKSRSKSTSKASSSREGADQVKQTESKSNPAPSARKTAADPLVGSQSGRSRPKDVNKQNDPRNLPDEHRPHDDGDKPKADVETALQVLRDGIHPGTPFGYVTKDDSHRDQYGVPQVNEAAAKALVKEGLASVFESKIRLTG